MACRYFDCSLDTEEIPDFTSLDIGNIAGMILQVNNDYSVVLVLILFQSVFYCLKLIFGCGYLDFKLKEGAEGRRRKGTRPL